MAGVDASGYRPKPGRLVIGDADSAWLSGEVVELLFSEGFWDRLREAGGLDPFVFDRYEGDEVPADRLRVIASAAREFAAQYAGSGRLSVVYARKGSDELVATVERTELRDAALTVARVADEAAASGVPLWVAL
jgi:hypothetical protein